MCKATLKSFIDVSAGSYPFPAANVMVTLVLVMKLLIEIQCILPPILISLHADINAPCALPAPVFIRELETIAKEFFVAIDVRPNRAS